MARASLYEFKRDGILQTIESLMLATGRSPSMREIAKVCDVSVATLHSYLSRMREEGLIEWSPRSHRSLRLARRTGYVDEMLGF